MERLIHQAFKHVDVIGPHVLDGHYDLHGPNGEIILPSVWEQTIQPDWAIMMVMWPLPEPPAPPPVVDEPAPLALPAPEPEMTIVVEPVPILQPPPSPPLPPVEQIIVTKTTKTTKETVSPPAPSKAEIVTRTRVKSKSEVNPLLMWTAGRYSGKKTTKK